MRTIRTGCEEEVLSLILYTVFIGRTRQPGYLLLKKISFFTLFSGISIHQGEECFRKEAWFFGFLHPLITEEHRAKSPDECPLEEILLLYPPILFMANSYSLLLMGFE